MTESQNKPSHKNKPNTTPYLTKHETKDGKQNPLSRSQPELEELYVHEQSIIKLGELNIPKTSIKHFLKNIHQNAINYLTYLVLNKGKLDNKQNTNPPP